VGERTLIVARRSSSGPLALGVGTDFPEELRAVVSAVTAHAATAPSASQPTEGRSDSLYRNTINGVIVDSRTLAISGGLHWDLIVMLPLAGVEAPVWAATAAVLATVCIFLLIGVSAATMIAYAISRPIFMMSRELAKIGDLQFPRSGPIRSSIREIDMMARSLVRMKAALRSFSLYVPIDVVRQVLTSGQGAEPGGEVRALTVLVSDVAGFTGIAKACRPGNWSAT
jgi:hypothetical protein